MDNVTKGNAPITLSPQTIKRALHLTEHLPGELLEGGRGGAEQGHLPPAVLGPPQPQQPPGHQLQHHLGLQRQDALTLTPAPTPYPQWLPSSSPGPPPLVDQEGGEGVLLVLKPTAIVVVVVVTSSRSTSYTLVKQRKV